MLRNILEYYNDELFLIYSNNKKPIIIFDLIAIKTIKIIENVHYDFIINLHHYLDTIEITDLILSVSYDNDIKLWNYINFEYLLDIKNINEN